MIKYQKHMVILKYNYYFFNRQVQQIRYAIQLPIKNTHFPIFWSIGYFPVLKKVLVSLDKMYFLQLGDDWQTWRFLEYVCKHSR